MKQRLNGLICMMDGTAGDINTMNIEFPNSEVISEAEKAELVTLQHALEAAIADGVLDRQERDRITSIMQRDHKITPDELALVRAFINAKVEAGELTLDYS